MMTFTRPVAVPYYRVSTAKQGASGLGLEAQKAAVQAFCKARDLTVDGDFVEVESGRRDDRPELAKAFAKAKRLRGIVVIARLDRLARDVHFISGLIKRGVAFAAVDAPDDDATMLHFRAVIAEEEARKIGARTKAALAAAKARGVVLGSPQNFTAEGRAKGSAAGAAARRAQGRENRAAIRDLIHDARRRGLSIRAIAAEVGASPMMVSRVLKEADHA